MGDPLTPAATQAALKLLQAQPEAVRKAVATVLLSLEIDPFWNLVMRGIANEITGTANDFGPATQEWKV